MREQLNCPNCGQPIASTKCEYCGTLFYDFANIDIEKESYIRMKIGDTLCVFKALTESIEVEDRSFSMSVCTDYMGHIHHIPLSPDWVLTLQMRILADDEGVLLERLHPGGDKNG